MDDLVPAISGLIVAMGLWVFVMMMAPLIACALMTQWLANEKGYPSGKWFLLGLFFNGFALLTMVGAPGRQAPVTFGAVEDEIRSYSDRKPAEG